MPRRPFPLACVALLSVVGCNSVLGLDEPTVLDAGAGTPSSVGSGAGGGGGTGGGLDGGCDAAWAPTGTLGSPRYSATATVLEDGRVLVASAAPAPSGTAETFDPGSGMWSDAGSTAFGGFYVPVLLKSKKVLFAGGKDAATNMPRSGADLYDPDTGKWTKTGPMGEARDSAVGALLSDGRVLVAGGYDASGTSLSSAEIYDPSAGTWSPTGAMSQARYSALAALRLDNGRVLVIGGIPDPMTILTSTELYDPVTHTWSDAGSMAELHYFGVASLLPSGDAVLVVGGQPETGGTERWEYADPTWKSAGILGVGLSTPGIALLTSGQVLVAGGSSANVPLDGTNIYDPSTGWRPGPPMHEARFTFPLAALPDGRALAVGGGIGPYYAATDACELYCP